MRRLELTGIGATRVGNVPVIILRTEGEDRVIPIQVGPLELMAIASELQGETPARPTTHDLLTTIVRELAAEVTQVAITEVHDEALHALVTLTTPSGVIDVDARPSDAIALAVRAHAPIFASEEVVDEASVEIERDESQDDAVADATDPRETIARFRAFLDVVDPEDFAAPADEGDKPPQP